jgi:hypothetical protein
MITTGAYDKNPALQATAQTHHAPADSRTDRANVACYGRY